MVGMNREHTIELSSSDTSALCLIFLDGRIASMGHGTVSAPVHPGQHVRWFVRARRRNATFALLESRRGSEQLVDEGRCEARFATGEHLAEKRRARRAQAASGSRVAPVARAARVATEQRA